MDVCAGIVLCNPDIDRLARNINAVMPQVSKLILVDNASENIDQVQQVVAYDKIDLIRNAENKGVASALNQLIDHADQQGFQWILTLDDDSISSSGMVAELLTATTRYDRIAIVSSRTIDRDTADSTDNEDKRLPGIEDIDMCITAGSLTNIKAVLDAGGFDERLFIDHVDHDMCLRLKRRGYKIIRVNTAVLFQEFGEETVRRRFLWKVYTQRGYAPTRVYYQTRNSIYMLRKYGKEFRSGPFYYYFHLIFAFFARFLYEPKRFRRLRTFIRGYFAGLSMKIEK